MTTNITATKTKKNSKQSPHLLIQLAALRGKFAHCVHGRRHVVLLDVGAARAVLRLRAKGQLLVEVRRLIVDEAERVARHAPDDQTRQDAERGAHHLGVVVQSSPGGNSNSTRQQKQRRALCTTTSCNRAGPGDTRSTWAFFYS